MRAKSINFERAQDPKTSIGIGLKYKAFPIIAIYMDKANDWVNGIDAGEILKDMLSSDGYITANYYDKIFVKRDPAYKDTISRVWSTVELKEKGYSGVKWAHIFVPFGPPELKENINFERGKDPKTSMNIGLSPQRRFADLKVGDVLELKEDLPKLGYPKGALAEIIKIIEDDRPNKLRFNFKLYDAGVLVVESREWLMSLEFFDEFFKTPKKTVMEAQNFERGKDPKTAMKIGAAEAFKNYIRNFSAEIFPNAGINFNRFNTFSSLYMDFNSSSKVAKDDIKKWFIHNTPYYVQNISIKIADFSRQMRWRVYNYRIQLDYRVFNESINFEKGGNIYKNIGIGQVRPYPQMTPDQFERWYNREIVPYLDDEDQYQALADNLIRNTWETDSEVSRFLMDRNIERSLVKELIEMRDYFNDEKYISKLRTPYDNK